MNQALQKILLSDYCMVAGYVDNPEFTVFFNTWRPAIWAGSEGQILVYQGAPMVITKVDLENERIVLRTQVN